MSAAEVPVRDAATVVLLRDDPSGVQTWLLTRVSQMTFAAGMSVFPGGRVEQTDADLPFASPVTATAARLACTETLARALLGAAVRETFEETGVLLTRPSPNLAAARADVEAGRLPFDTLLRDHDLAIDPTALQAWARWVTPAGETRRYDARFFVAALPDGAVARDASSESVTASWLPVEQALDEAGQGRRAMLPPTVLTLSSLLPFGSVADVLAAAAARDLTAMRPRLRAAADGALIAELPDGSSMVIPRPVPQ